MSYGVHRALRIVVAVLGMAGLALAGLSLEETARDWPLWMKGAAFLLGGAIVIGVPGFIFKRLVPISSPSCTARAEANWNWQNKLILTCSSCDYGAAASKRRNRI